MKRFIANLFMAGATATLFAASASAQLMVQGVGSSAQFQAAPLAAYQLVGAAGGGHWTCKNAGNIIDNRGDANSTPQTGNLAVVWSNDATPKVWTYLSVDTIVGNRAYFSQPRASLAFTGGAPANCSAANSQLISSAYWGADAAAIPANVQALINGVAFNAAYTDILPADAKFGQNRINCGTAATATLPCLGYGTGDPNVGAPIISSFSSSTALPVNFNIYGNDPISGAAIPAYTVVPVGISPMILIVNRTNTATGLGQPWVAGCTGFSSAGYCFNDATYQATVQLLFTGTDCDGTAFGGFTSSSPNYLFAISPILREPLSGTMNVFEFNFMVQNGQGLVADGYFSQESVWYAPYYDPITFGAIQPATNNPLNGACPGGNPFAVGPQGNRRRVVGTGEMVGKASSPTGVYGTADSIGYTFFSFGNVAALANNPNYGYLSYQEQDPINPAAVPAGGAGPVFNSGGIFFPGNGKLPTCATPCPITPGTSFPNIRNGAYKQWNLLRVVADTGSTALTNVQAVATVQINQTNSTQPDYMPFNAASDGDPGFIAYRIHFAPGMPGNVAPLEINPPATPTPSFSFNAGNVPNNGITNPALEAGGDVGGCLNYKFDPNPTGCRY
jgi:hypothetical protein